MKAYGDEIIEGQAPTPFLVLPILLFLMVRPSMSTLGLVNGQP